MRVNGVIAGTQGLTADLLLVRDITGRLSGDFSLAATVVPIGGVSYATEEDGIVTITGGVTAVSEEDGIITITGLPWSDNNGILQLLSSIYYGTITGQLAPVLELGG